LIIAADGTLRDYPVGTSGLGSGKVLGRGFAHSSVASAGDWNGDGHQDVVARSDGRLSLLRSTGSSLSSPVGLGSAKDHRIVTGVGDLTRDGRPDVVVVTTSNVVWLLPGDGRTGRQKSIKLATGWRSQDLVRGIGDLTGDKIPDLVARSGDRLYLYAGTKNGIKAGRSLGNGWAKYASITSVGDLNSDGRADLIARTSGGSLVLFLGTKSGTLSSGRTIATGFKGTRFAT
jgi:hypothetical protein